MAQPARPDDRWDELAAAPDGALVSRVLHGEHDAFAILFDRYARQVYNIAYRIGGDAAEAEDLTQDAFLQVFRTLHTLQQPQAFAAWLYHVATNICLNARRRRALPRAELSEAVAQTHPDESRWRSPHDVAQASDDRHMVWAALRRLTPKQRAALTLRELHGRGYADIAAVLGLSAGAVEVLIFRARRRFREQYERLAVSETRLPRAEKEPACRQVRASLAAVLDDEGRQEERAAVLAHVRSCEACQRELATQRAARRARTVLPLLPLPAAVKPSLFAHLSLPAGAPAGSGTATAATTASNSGASGAATTMGGSGAGHAGTVAVGAKAGLLAGAGTKGVLVAVGVAAAVIVAGAVPLSRARHHSTPPVSRAAGPYRPLPAHAIISPAPAAHMRHTPRLPLVQRPGAVSRVRSQPPRAAAPHVGITTRQGTRVAIYQGSLPLPPMHIVSMVRPPARPTARPALASPASARPHAAATAGGRTTRTRGKTTPRRRRTVNTPLVAAAPQKPSGRPSASPTLVHASATPTTLPRTTATYNNSMGRLKPAAATAPAPPMSTAMSVPNKTATTVPPPSPTAPAPTAMIPASSTTVPAPSATATVLLPASTSAPPAATIPPPTATAPVRGSSIHPPIPLTATIVPAAVRKPARHESHAVIRHGSPGVHPRRDSPHTSSSSSVRHDHNSAQQAWTSPSSPSRGVTHRARPVATPTAITPTPGTTTHASHAPHVPTTASPTEARRAGHRENSPSMTPVAGEKRDTAPARAHPHKGPPPQVTATASADTATAMATAMATATAMAHGHVSDLGPAAVHGKHATTSTPVPTATESVESAAMDTTTSSTVRPTITATATSGARPTMVNQERPSHGKDKGLPPATPTPLPSMTPTPTLMTPTALSASSVAATTSALGTPTSPVARDTTSDTAVTAPGATPTIGYGKDHGGGRDKP